MEPDEKIIKILVDEKKVDRKNLIGIYNIHKANKQPLEKLVVEFGLAKREDVLKAKTEVYEAKPYVFDKEKINLEVARQIPLAMAKRYNLICPGETEDGKMIIAMSDPNDSFALEYVQMRTGKALEPFVVLQADLENIWEEIYEEATRKKHPFFNKKKAEAKTPIRVIPSKLSLPGLSRSSNLVVPEDTEKARENIEAATEKIREKVSVEDEQCHLIIDTLKNELRVLSDLSRSVNFLNSSLGEQEVVCRILETGTRVLRAKGASILMLEEDKFHLYFREALGPKSSQLKSIRIPLNDKSIAGYVVLNRMPLAVNNVDQDPRHNKDVDRAIDYQTYNLACAPILWGEEVIGVMEMVNKEEGDFNEKDLEYLGILANQAAVAIHNAILIEQFQNFYMEVVEILIDCLESMDSHNRHHALEVARLTSAIAKEVNISGDEYETLCYAAFLHDLGMIKVHSPEMMEKHPALGARMLSHIRFFQDVAPIVHYHHERFDGEGYPDGLSEESIPVGARILSIAEGFLEGKTEAPELSDAEYMDRFLSQFGTAYDPGLKLPFMAAIDKFLRNEDDSNDNENPGGNYSDTHEE